MSLTQEELNVDRQKRYMDILFNEWLIDRGIHIDDLGAGYEYAKIAFDAGYEKATEHAW